MQTSLRGLIAQQRMLDTTGHNIANASTVGYSRQEATLSASLAQQIQVSGSANQTGAHLGAGVDVVRASAASATVPRRAVPRAEHEPQPTGRPAPRASTPPSSRSPSPATPASTPS